MLYPCCNLAVFDLLFYGLRKPTYRRLSVVFSPFFMESKNSTFLV